MNLYKKLTSPEEDYDNLQTYELIESGKTKGLFQLESQLLSSYSKKLKPKNIDDVSMLISGVRPGTLEAEDEETGLNMMQVLCKRKNGELDVKYEFPQLEPFLRNTYGVILYQEEIIEIAKDLAGFSLKDADLLRIACGKKIPEKMTEVKKLFIEGCQKVGKVNEEEAIKIFDIIEKSQRYLFNKSHGVCYSITSYITGFLKKHHPLEFYVSWLRHAKNKQDSFSEIKDLVDDAKYFGYQVNIPSLKSLNKEFKVVDGEIRFGLSNIRGIGEKQVEKLEKHLSQIQFPTWNDFLFASLGNINHSVFVALICSGALDFFNEPRQKMLYELNNLKNLTDNDISHLKTLNGTLIERFSQIQPTTKINNRKIPEKKYKFFQSILQILKNPPFKLIDTADFIAYNEEEYLGAPITCSVVDGKNTSQANCTVQQILQNKMDNYICVGVVLDSVKEHTVKKGKTQGRKMFFVKASDSTGSFDVVVFADKAKEYQSLLTEKNTILIRGAKSKDGDSFLLEKAWQL